MSTDIPAPPQRPLARRSVRTTGPEPRSSSAQAAAPRDVDIGPLLAAATAATRAGQGFPPDLDRVRNDFERDASEQEGDRS